MKFACIIPAAGKGNRFGASIPKQFLYVQGRMIIEHAIISIINGFKKCNIESPSLIIPCDEEYQEIIYDCCIKYVSEHAFALVRGGENRQDSINNAIQHPLTQDSDFICIHDAARPFIPSTVMHSLISACQDNECIIPVLDIVDTIKEVDHHTVHSTLNRSRYKLAQTPQFFKTNTYLHALQTQDANTIYTDDSSLMEYAGFTIHTVQGSDLMRKVTIPYDLDVAELHARIIQDQYE